MASADFDAIRVAIADTLAALDIRTYSFQPSNLHPPAVYVSVGDFDYDFDFDGDINFPMILTLICPSVLSEGGQTMLNGFISPAGDTSVRAVLATNPTLDGTVQSFEVRRHRKYGAVVLPDQASRYWSAEIVVDIIA